MRAGVVLYSQPPVTLADPSTWRYTLHTPYVSALTIQLVVIEMLLQAARLQQVS